MAGKNKLERAFLMQWDDSDGSPQDLSGDLIPGSLTGGGLVFDEVDVTGVSESVRNYLAGHAESTISGKFHFNDTATTGSHTVFLGTYNTVGTLTLQWGNAGTAPTTGDPEWEGEYILLVADVAMEGGKAVYNVTWQPSGSTAPDFGTVA